jgi:hypothetical protein
MNEAIKMKGDTLATMYELLSKEQKKYKENVRKSLLALINKSGILGEYNWEISDDSFYHVVSLRAKGVTDIEAWKFFLSEDPLEIEGIGKLWVIWKERLVLSLDYLKDATKVDICSALDKLNISNIITGFVEMHLEERSAEYKKEWDSLRNVIEASKIVKMDKAR